MVRGVSDFAMMPKAFFTNPAAEHFVHLYLHKDITQMATDFESTILANGLMQLLIIDNVKTAIQNGLRASLCKVTNNPMAVMEFKAYNDLVQHVKLVEWNHSSWANPSDLKGGIDSLENVVLAIQANTCKFIKIMPQEAKEWQHCINNGEILTPKVEPPMPPDLPTPNSTQPSMHNTQTSLLPTPKLMWTSTPEPTQSSSPTVFSPYICPSSIMDDMVDPVLCALDNAASDNRPMVQSPPTPPMPPPSLPMAHQAQVAVTTTNHSKRSADTLPTGTLRSKRACKLTEKGQSELESRKHTRSRPRKKGQCLKKSNALVESDHENV
ncbi:hypothetical protein BDR04DRAFT_1162203 [Suillus decipiens]|nr:hypothetical protein BDR04DRAFT_1162203 [Suillus decipiens]